MNKLIQQLFFVVPIVALIAAPFIFDATQSNRTASVNETQQQSAEYASSKRSIEAEFEVAKVMDNPQYAMMEPFSSSMYFAWPSNLQESMNPALWTQFMFNMAYQMQLNFLEMQKNYMSAIQVKPLNSRSTQQPMTPEEYKKWYEQQIKKMKQNQN